MHRRSGALKLLSAAFFSVLLAACASTPVTAPPPSFDTALPAPAAASLAPLTLVTIEDPSIANLDVSGRPDEDIWQRMRTGFAMPDLTTSAAQEKTAWYAARGEYLKRSFERARPFLYHIVEELEKRGMPTELALLPLVESAYNPRAVSPAQAAGMWQFIPSTGKKYNLTQDWWRDERRDIIASTTAALDYLQFLHGLFNDWHLALASYNWGEGAVGRAVERARAKGEPADYASLRMPAETAGYVPKLQAIKNIVMNPGLYNIALPNVPNAPYFATFTKTRDIDVKTAARLADMPLEEFLALNPAHNRPVIPGANRPTLILPAEKVDVFKQNLENAEGKQLSSWKAYALKAGEKLEQVAARFGMDLTTLKLVNGIGPRSSLKPGHTLLVAKDIKAPDEVLPVNLDQPALLAQERIVRSTHVVKKGETLATIAGKYKVRADDLKKWNRLTGALALGQKLAIEQVVMDQPAKRRIAAKPAPKGKVAAKPKRSVRVAKR
jgi:membrane-bound lytic murein transglycosylase D